MSVLVSCSKISKSFSKQALFKELSFAIDSDDRIGLIGPNGAGKSTLLKILARQETADEGLVSFAQGLRVGYLAQVPQFKAGHTILEALMAEMGKDANLDWEIIDRAQRLISKMDLEIFGEDFPIAKLSGGWKKRVAIARELMKEPDLLLLDEPTNHLDIDTILWLENLIESLRCATLTITHDRVFLQAVSNRIIEINKQLPGGLLSLKGEYVDFIEKRGELIASQEKREVILKNTLRRETEWLRRGAKARTTKQQARIQRHEVLSKEVGEISNRNQVSTARISFDSKSKNPKKLIEAKQISKTLGGRTLFADVNLLLSPGTRIGLIGANGSGKSTLIRALMKEIEPDLPSQKGAEGGTVAHADGLEILYFDQARESLDPDVTLFRTLCPTGDYVLYRGESVHVRSYLDRFLFRTEQAEMRVGQMSGGEQARLLLARLMLRPANVLILDEPTNDLDMSTLGLLEDCLTSFQGAVILVSHDRYFLDQVSTKLLAFPPIELQALVSTTLNSHSASNSTKPSAQITTKSKVELVECASMYQWQDWYKDEIAALAALKKAVNSGKSPSTGSSSLGGATSSMGASSSLSAESASSGFVTPGNERQGPSDSGASNKTLSKTLKKLSFKEIRELEVMEAKIQEVEARIETLTRDIDNPSTQANPTKLREITRTLTESQSEIETLFARWAELDSRR